MLPSSAKKWLKEIKLCVESTDKEEFLGILEKITARLHQDNPGVFPDVNMSNIRDMTSYVAKLAPSEQLDTVSGVDASIHATMQIGKMCDGLRVLVAVYHTEQTDWFFKYRALSGALTSTTAGMTPWLDGFCCAILCPLILFAPNFNEITVATQFIMRPNCPDAQIDFENQFRGFLTDTVLCEPGSVMTITCGACNAETTGLVTVCGKCKCRMCDSCMRTGKCPCKKKPVTIRVPSNATLAEVSTVISMSDRADTRPSEEVVFMPTGL